MNSDTKPKLDGQRRTNPFIWCGAIICAILALAVIAIGIAVFIGYVVIRPKIPVMSVTYTHLDRMDYDRAGTLTVQLTILLNAANGNARATASFYDTLFTLGFHGEDIAHLVAEPFEVGRNSSVEYRYVAESTPIPLDPAEREVAELSLRRNLITFNLKGSARTRWRVGLLGSVKFGIHLDCPLQFFPLNQTSTNLHCSSKSK